MELKLENLFCHAELSAELREGVNLVTGRNSSGKTSVATVLAALASGTLNPLGFSAAERKNYIMDGRHEGGAYLGDVHWSPVTAVITPPTDQEYPYSCAEAVGLVEFVRRRSPKERARVWEDIFTTEDPRVLLTPVWEKQNRPATTLEGLIETIERDGWDAAAAVYEAKRKKEKQEWGRVTGERYGSDKATKWTPDGWTSELETASEQDLQDQLATAREELVATQSAHAVSQAEIDEAKSVRDSTYLPLKKEVEELETALADARQEKHAADHAREQADEKLAQYKRNIGRAKELTGAKAPHSCPNCGHGLVVEGGKVEGWVAPDDERVAGANRFLAGVKKGLPDLEGKAQTAQAVVIRMAEKENEIRSKLANAQGGMKALEPKIALADTAPTAAVSEDVIRDLENRVAELVNSLQVWRKMRDAKRYHLNVVEYDALCTLVGPEGVRAKKIRKALTSVNTLLEKICGIAGWQKVKITDSYDITVNGRPAILVAENEQCKAQWAIQIVFARLRKSKIVVLDACDRLRDESWDGLENVADAMTKAAAERGETFALIICATSAPARDHWNVLDLDVAA